MNLLDIILHPLLNNNGFTVNPLKCEWVVKETDWLGYWGKRSQAMEEKDRCNLLMDRPRTPKALCGFIGCVNYYWDTWPSRAHVLKPLTDKSGLRKGEKLIWTDEMQEV